MINISANWLMGKDRYGLQVNYSFKGNVKYRHNGKVLRKVPSQDLNIFPQ